MTDESSAAAPGPAGPDRPLPPGPADSVPAGPGIGGSAQEDSPPAPGQDGIEAAPTGDRTAADAGAAPPPPDSAPGASDVLSHARVISLCTLASRILGLAREILAAGFFGAGMAWDAFAFAFQFPNLFRRIFGEGALSAAFIPVFSEQLAKAPPARAHRFMSAVLTLLAAVTLGIMGAAMALAILLPPLLGPHTGDPEKLSLICRLSLILMPYLPLICIVALLSAILNCLKHFLMPALASVVLNVCWIGGFGVAFLWGADALTQVYIVAGAIVVGGVVELVMQIPALRARGVAFTPNLDWRQPGVLEVGRLMGPTVFGLAVIQVNLIVDNLIAEIFVPGHGAVATLYFGNRLMQFPLALIGIALAQAVFPYLSDAAAQGNLAGMGTQLSRALRVCLFVSVPATAGLVVLAEPTVQLLFQWKNFDAAAAARCTRVVAAYAAGIWAYCCIHVVTRAFHALKDTRTPVKIGAAIVGLNVALNLLLVHALGEAGLAWSTTVSAIVNFSILTRVLRRQVAEVRLDGVWRTGLVAAAASIAMAGACWGVLALLPAADAAGTLGLLGGRALRVLAPIVAGAAVFFGIALALDLPEAHEVMRALKRRRSRSVAPPR